MNKPIIAIALAALSGAAYGETFKDAAGRIIGSSRVDGNGVTRFYDGANRTTGSARTDSNGVVKFYDASGRVVGKKQPR